MKHCTDLYILLYLFGYEINFTFIDDDDVVVRFWSGPGIDDNGDDDDDDDDSTELLPTDVIQVPIRYIELKYK